MNFTNVLLLCLCGIAGCVALVFAVETLVAFFFHEEEQAAAAGQDVSMPMPTLSLRTGGVQDSDLEQAA